MKIHVRLPAIVLLAALAALPVFAEPTQPDSITRADRLFGLLTLDQTARATQPDDASTQPQHEEGEENNGQDISRPVRRVDLRYQFQDMPGHTQNNLFTLRMDWPIEFAKEWKLNTRIDLPLSYGNVPSLDNPHGDDEFGSSDVLAQALLIHPLTDELIGVVGTQVIFPTASQDQFGGGKFRLVPTVAGVYRPHWLPKGWWTGMLVRYDFDVAGDHRDFRQSLIFQPLLNIALPAHFFATFAPEMKLALEDGGDWFIPFDVTVGTMLNQSTVVSIEYKHAIVNDFPQYDWAIEFRIGFFF